MSLDSWLGISRFNKFCQIHVSPGVGPHVWFSLAASPLAATTEVAPMNPLLNPPTPPPAVVPDDFALVVGLTWLLFCVASGCAAGVRWYPAFGLLASLSLLGCVAMLYGPTKRTVFAYVVALSPAALAFFLWMALTVAQQHHQVVLTEEALRQEIREQIAAFNARPSVEGLEALKAKLESLRQHCRQFERRFPAELNEQLALCESRLNWHFSFPQKDGPSFRLGES
jgi:hypothetical protein